MRLRVHVCERLKVTVIYKISQTEIAFWYETYESTVCEGALERVIQAGRR